MPTITSEIIIGYSQCPRKAYLLLFEKEEEIAVEYIELLKKRKQNHQETCLNSIATIYSEITLPQAQELKYLGTYISKVTLKFNEFQAECDLLYVEQVEEGNINNLRYEPRIFTGTYSVTKEQKLKLLFIGYLLQKILKIPIDKGKIISLDNSYHTIKLNDNSKFVKPLINPIEEWSKTFPSEAPPVILNKSGLESLVYRYRWEEKPNPKIQQILINYNREYCQAFKLLTDVISSLNEIANTHDYIDFVDQPKEFYTEKGQLVHRQFEIILETAHRDYDKNKISLRSLDNQKTFQKRKTTQSTKVSKNHKQFLINYLQPDLSVEVKPLKYCPVHLNQLTVSKYLSSKTIIDLIFSKNGVTKKVIRYFGNKSYCEGCNRYYPPPNISNRKSTK